MLSHISRCIWLFATLWIVACQPPLSMGFSRQEYWNGLPCPPPGDLPDPRDRTQGSCIAGRFFTSGPAGEALTELIHVVFWYCFDFVFHLWLSDSSGVYSDNVVSGLDPVLSFPIGDHLSQHHLWNKKSTFSREGDRGAPGFFKKKKVHKSSTLVFDPSFVVFVF